MFLLVATEGVDGIHHESRLHADETAHARVATLQFLRHQAVFHVGHARAAIALEIGAEEPQLRHRLHQFAWEAARAIALFDDGDKIVFDELASGIADQALVIGEQSVEIDEINAAKLDG